VPDGGNSFNSLLINTLGKDSEGKARFTPVTQHDTGRAEAARSLENPGYHATQLTLQGQPNTSTSMESIRGHSTVMMIF
jgi:hypothetical protein